MWDHNWGWHAGWFEEDETSEELEIQATIPYGQMYDVLTRFDKFLSHCLFNLMIFNFLISKMYSELKKKARFPILMFLVMMLVSPLKLRFPPSSFFFHSSLLKHFYYYYCLGDAFMEAFCRQFCRVPGLCWLGWS